MSGSLREYPETITIDGELYSVSVDRDSEGEIEYFNLQDSEGEFLLEADWQGSFTVEDVMEIYNSDKSSHTAEVTTEKNALPVTDEISPENDELKNYTDFDNHFPHLATYPNRFKNIAVRLWDSNFYESHDYQDIVVSELVGYYDECCLDGEEAVEEFYRLEED